MSKQGKSLGLLLLTVLIIALLLYVVFYGVTIGSYHISSTMDPENGIRRGLDLVGGSVITYEAQTDSIPTEAEMSTVVTILQKRVDSMGYTEATVAKQGTKKVRVEIPAVSDPDEAMKILGKTAQLTFVDYEGNVVLEGKDIKNASHRYEQIRQNGPKEHHIALEFTPEGAVKFAQVTERISMLPSGENVITTMLDDEPIETASVNEKIDSDTAIISGNMPESRAKMIADLIRSGNLPFGLKNVQSGSIGATLGAEALSTSLLAGGIGILLVLVFMLVYYRLLGVVADISLLAYIGIVMFIMGKFHINLSLPGIAGIVLSIGMAVDANVVIYERIREELRRGKSIAASIDAGFNRAFSAIIDSNITTLIAAVVLWIFGTGPIQGFAQTLALGVVVSMLTAITLTKFILKLLVGMNIKNPRLYAKMGGSNNV